MKQNVVAPSVGESITEVSLLKWAKDDGAAVDVGDLLLEIESDKATVEVVAEAKGALKILKQEGERVPVGEVIAEIDESAEGTQSASAPKEDSSPSEAPSSSAPQPAESSASAGMGPAAKKIAAEKGIDPSQVQGTGKDGRVTKGDLLQFNPAETQKKSASSAPATPDQEGVRRVPMPNIRKTIAKRLVEAQQTAALLTTFNEVDMSAVMNLRKEHKESFKEKHGVNLGFMSFFTRAVVESLKVVPDVNANIEGDDILYHDFINIGVAVGTDRGLVVPVLRHAENMGFVEIEKTIVEMATRARDGKLGIKDMTGGTFTITNGGVYGSLLSTPIVNFPQSGILGMHSIKERAVVVDGKIEARPMMYLALSYDHRLIDGKGAVTFLVTLKELLEEPSKLGLEY